jgi:hypothetical protein
MGAGGAAPRCRSGRDDQPRGAPLSPTRGHGAARAGDARPPKCLSRDTRGFGRHCESSGWSGPQWTRLLRSFGAQGRETTAALDVLSWVRPSPSLRRDASLSVRAGPTQSFTESSTRSQTWRNRPTPCPTRAICVGEKPGRAAEPRRPASRCREVSWPGRRLATRSHFRSGGNRRHRTHLGPAEVAEAQGHGSPGRAGWGTWTFRAWRMSSTDLCVTLIESIFCF